MTANERASLKCHFESLSQDALLTGLDDMGNVNDLREVVAVTIAGKLRRQKLSLLPI